MRVRPAVLDAIIDHARRERPRECCGLLIGTDSILVEAVACANCATEPERRYTLAPENYFAQIRRCRGLGNGMRVAGVYHSHPRSSPEPSPTDLDEAFTGFLYVIAGPIGPDAGPEVRAYMLIRGILQCVDLIPEAPERPAPR